MLDLNEMYESVKKFNNIAGNQDLSIKGFRNQQGYVHEEAIKEVNDALRDNNVVKLLDGVIDGLYTIFGQLQKLEMLGCNIYGAAEKVCNDNLNKYPISKEEAQKTVLHYNSKNIHVTYQYNPEYKRYVIKDTNQKVRKPYNFVATDLTEYVPQELREKGLDDE